MSPVNELGQHVVAFIDIGTNSIRLLVVRINVNGSYLVLSQEKEMVRLGEAEFKDNIIRPDAIDRAVIVCRKFVDLSHYYGAREVIAVATSAAREAQNQAEFLERVRTEAFVDVSVISGKEEARLIFLGVSSGINIGKRNALFLDIGGGSCEIMIGDQLGYSYLDSLNLGAIRMTSMFVPEGHKGPMSPDVYAKMRKYVKAAIIRTKKRVREERIDMAIASSGTAINLAQIAARHLQLPGGKQLTLRRSHLRKVTAMLCALPLDKRKLVPGINPERADIILGGAATLETLMEELGLEEVVISERGLRDGMLVEYLVRIGAMADTGNVSVRHHSALMLGRTFGLDEEHAGRVRSLAVQLFDSSAALGLHDLGPKERELMEHAAFLHDIGDFISFNNHHLHSHYIISNADLLGFDQREIAVMANLARFHRKKVPGRKDPDLAGLDERSQRTVVMLSALLRVAESLDRSHSGIVTSAMLTKLSKEGVVLEVQATQECQMEIWGVETDRKAFEKAFDRDLVLKIVLHN
ncbi:MAG TPA: Ppx/GppA phosphatase family protein [Methanomassiliicoccales archaeon]|nr:Ppx/GppA phosphatase family protein [Methanomassiliicoccales archaeon]